MAKMTVKVEGGEELAAKLRLLGQRAMGMVQTATAAGAEIAAEAAKSRAPGPHVEYELDKVYPGKAEFAIGPDAEHWYYQFFETGASEHEIDGDVKKALRFMDGAEEVIVRRVKHPGMAAEPFLRPALDERKDEISREFGRVLLAEILKVIR